METKKLRKRQSIGGKMGMETRWGKRFLVSIFPLKGGSYRLTLRHMGEEYTFAGIDRSKLIDSAFNRIEEMTKK